MGDKESGSQDILGRVYEYILEEHGGTVGAISVYGQESNLTTWRLCQMNLARLHRHQFIIFWSQCNIVPRDSNRYYPYSTHHFNHLTQKPPIEGGFRFDYRLCGPEGQGSLN